VGSVERSTEGRRAMSVLRVWQGLCEACSTGHPQDRIAVMQQFAFIASALCWGGLIRLGWCRGGDAALFRDDVYDGLLFSPVGVSVNVSDEDNLPRCISQDKDFVCPS
ncbi:unnamed protein product, partial [Hapterophycus canaliculatus]